MVDFDATLCEELFEVPVGQPVGRYQRTAIKITSGGKRKPVNPKGILTGGLGRQVRFMEPPSPPRCDASTRQSLFGYVTADLLQRSDHPASRPSKPTSASGSRDGTPTPNHLCGRRPPNRSSDHSHDLFSELEIQGTSCSSVR